MTPFSQKAEMTGRPKAGYLIARLISDLANPLFIPTFVMAMVAHFQFVPAEEFNRIVALSLLFYTLIPLVMVIHMLRAGNIRSLDLPRQKARNPLFLFSVMSSAIGSAILASFFYLQRPFLTIVSVIFFLNPLAGYLLNQRWKISIHAAAVASAGTLLLVFTYSESGFYNPGAGIFSLFMLLILLPLIIWSRYYLNIHSIGEIVAGAAAGLFLTLMEIMLMIQLW